MKSAWEIGYINSKQDLPLKENTSMIHDGNRPADFVPESNQNMLKKEPPPHTVLQ